MNHHPFSPALLTDFYQLTMAYGYWKCSRAEDQAVFHLYFRKHPFNSGFTLAAGLESAVDYLNRFRFSAEDLAWLATLRDGSGSTMFETAFLDFLGEMCFSCDLFAVAEGTPVFPHEPLLRLEGPLIQCQLLETPLLNILNFQTLIATKAARICLAAQGDPVLEFGLRRAQGVDGSLSATRAAYIGGCTATSNVLAGKLLDIPVRGTHAHSWIMSFDSEKAAFAAYAEAMPNNSIFLVDTYDSVTGIANAIEAGKQLERNGGRFTGIRLDSGDLAALSIQAREMLDAAGFTHTVIVASNDLDEHRITALKASGAPIGVWGVGTRLVTGHPQAALGGVFKLAAIRSPGENWQYKRKHSEDAEKASLPGILQVLRYTDPEENAVHDLIVDENVVKKGGTVDMRHFHSGVVEQTAVNIADGTPLLEPVFEKGSRVADMPSLTEIHQRASQQVASLPAATSIDDSGPYPVFLEKSLEESIAG